MPLARVADQEGQHEDGAATELDVKTTWPQHIEETGHNHRAGHIEPGGHAGDAEQPPGHRSATQVIVFKARRSLSGHDQPDHQAQRQIADDDGVIDQGNCVHFVSFTPPVAWGPRVDANRPWALCDVWIGFLRLRTPVGVLAGGGHSPIICRPAQARRPITIGFSEMKREKPRLARGYRPRLPALALPSLRAAPLRPRSPSALSR